MNQAKDMENKLFKLKEDWLPLTLLLLLIIFFLYRGLFPLNGSQVLSCQYADISHYFFYILPYAFDTILKGQIPLWNPYIYGGTPFAAVFQTAVFYPLNCLYLILPTSSAINWTILLHLFLSGAFMYYLLKNYGQGRFGSIVASIVYTFSAFHIMHIYAGHLVLLATIIWPPLMFLFFDRFIRGGGLKYGIFLSITIVLQILAGYPQHVFYSLIALFFYLLFTLAWLYGKEVSWNKIGLKTIAFFAFIILVLSLSAIQILPTAEMTWYSTRANLSYEWVSTFSLPPESIITFLIPDFFGDMLTVPYWGKNFLWEMTGYLGILPLLLVVIAIFRVRKRTVWFFSFLALFSLIMAMGKYTPLLKLLYTWVPGFNLFRGSSKWIFLNAFSLAVISGFVADTILKHFDLLKDRRLAIVIISTTFLMMVSLVLMLKFFDIGYFKTAIERSIDSGDFYSNPQPYLQPGFETAATAAFRSSALRSFGLLLTGTAVLLLYGYKRLGRGFFILSFFAVITLDLFPFGMRYMVSFDSGKLGWDNQVVNFLKQDKGPFRAIAPDMKPNSGILSGIETLNGYDTIMLKRYSEFINLTQGLPPEESNLGVNITRVSKLTDMLNLKYIVLASGIRLQAPLHKLVFDNGEYSIYQNLKASPRAFVVHRTKLLRGREAIFKDMISPEFDPSAYAIIEEEIEDIDFASVKPGSKTEAVKFIHYSPNKVVLETELGEGGLLILGDIYYPGWKAYLDNRQTKIYRANYIMRAIALPAGRHLVEFRYQPISFKVGAAVSLATFIFAIGFLLWIRRRDKRFKLKNLIPPVFLGYPAHP